MVLAIRLPFQCFMSLIPRGFLRTSDGTDIPLNLSSSKGISGCRLWRVLRLRLVSVHMYKRVFVTPNSVPCMYSGDTDLTKSKELKHDNQEGPLIPLTYIIIHACVQAPPRQLYIMVYSWSKHISILTTELVSTASSAYLTQAAAVLRFGDSFWYGKMRTLPPFAVRKFFPGCSQKPHPYAPLNWSMFWTSAFPGKSHVQHMMCAVITKGSATPGTSTVTPTVTLYTLEQSLNTV